jgi:uncharacterized protein
MIRFILLICVILMFTLDAQSAAFNCTQATTSVEKMICSNENLSKFDDQLILAYRNALNSTYQQDSIKQGQRIWLKNVRNTCKNIECLQQVYSDRIAALNSDTMELTKKSTANKQGSPSSQLLENVEYYTVQWNTPDKLEGKVKLANGEYIREGPDGPQDIESVRMGNIAYGDLDGDGKMDAAVILYHNTGGTGTVTQVAAVLDANSHPRHVASRNLEDRTEIKELTIREEVIVIRLDNPRFYPGQEKNVEYRLKDSRLLGPAPFK